MKKLLASLALAGLSACTPDPLASLPDATPDRGGVSFDFAKISDERFGDTTGQGPDILTDEVRWSGVYTNTTPWRPIALPHNRGGTFRISCLTKVDQHAPGDCAIMMRIGTMSPHFRETPNRNKFSWCGFTRRADRWYPAMDTFEVRPGESHMRAVLFATNARVEIKDLTIREMPPPAKKEPLEFVTQFVDSLDGTFEVPEGQVGSIAFNWKQSGVSYLNRHLTLSLVLPKGLVFLGTTCAPMKDVTCTVGPAGETIATFKPVSLPAGIPYTAHWWGSQYALIGTAPGTPPANRVYGIGRFEGRYDDGKHRHSFASKPIRFTSGPAIHAPAPLRYMNGSFCMGAFAFPDSEPAARYAAFVAGAGCRWLIPHAATSYPLEAWRTNGIVRVTPYSGQWCVNGYKLGNGKVPEDERFVERDDLPSLGRPLPAPAQRMCPLAVAAETPYVRKVFTEIFNANLVGTDGLWANWEPYMFTNRGCCCPRCRKAFAAYVGKPESEIAAAWPTNYFRGGTYEKEGVAFRSINHGKIVKTVEKYVRAATIGSKSPVGFIPGVHFGQLTANWPEKTPMPEALVKDYVPGVEWVNFWGPYICWRRDKPFLYEPGAPLAHFLCAKDIRETADRTFPPADRPKLMAAPEGTCGWLHQPEDFERDFDAYFFNRYEACLPWTFPVGCDARYWRAFANATARAARYESYVWDGTRCDASVTLSPVPEYAARVPEPLARVPHHRDVSPLLHAAYEKAGARIVAVFNSWPAGEAFFKLALPELPQNGSFCILSDDGVLRTKDRASAAWSAAELASGVFLSVGAARCRVFEIVPESAFLKTLEARKPFISSRMTSAALEADYAARKATLANAAAQDAALCKSCIRGVTRDD